MTIYFITPNNKLMIKTLKMKSYLANRNYKYYQY